MIYIPGFKNSGGLDYSVTAVRSAYRERGDHNVIVVDWSYYAQNTLYGSLIPQLRIVSENLFPGTFASLNFSDLWDDRREFEEISRQRLWRGYAASCWTLAWCTVHWINWQTFEINLWQSIWNSPFIWTRPSWYFINFISFLIIPDNLRTQLWDIRLDDIFRWQFWLDFKFWCFLCSINS